MGLDIYVGSLTRYYTRNWETVVQKYGREAGLQVQVMRPPGSIDSPKTEAATQEARAIVTTWRSQINASLEEHLDKPLDWDESDKAPYFTDKPAWDGHAALILLAAHQEHPHFPVPEKAPTEFGEDAAWKASTKEGFKSAYYHLLTPEFWLPADFDFTFIATDPAGKEMCFGSNSKLLEQLWMLNENTFRLNREEITKYRRENAEFNGPFTITARFGLSMLIELTEQSVAHRLPMKLDY